MPVDLDKKQIRNARMEDLPASKRSLGFSSHFLDQASVLAILNDAILRTNVRLVSWLYSELTILVTRLYRTAHR